MIKKKLTEDEYRRRWYILSEFISQKGLNKDFEDWYEGFKKNPLQPVKPLSFTETVWKFLRKMLPKGRV